MKNPLKALKSRLMTAPQPATTTHVTALNNFTPHVAPGLQIQAALIRGDTIEVHYKRKAA